MWYGMKLEWRLDEVWINRVESLTYQIRGRQARSSWLYYSWGWGHRRFQSSSVLKGVDLSGFTTSEYGHLYCTTVGPNLVLILVSNENEFLFFSIDTCEVGPSIPRNCWSNRQLSRCRKQRLLQLVIWIFETKFLLATEMRFSYQIVISLELVLGALGLGGSPSSC